MVVVRESPHAHRSPDKPPAQWPPRSPFQALLSSPSGRKKWQSRHEDSAAGRATSPSPSKGSAKALRHVAEASEDDEDEEERQARLELARIEAELRLNEIRKRKKRKEQAGAEKEAVSGEAAVSRATARSPTRLRAAAEVEVPLSPIRERAVATEQLSPARRRLGLNAVAKAQDVSLKRARDGTQLLRSKVGSKDQTPRPGTALSFNDRLRAARVKVEEREEKLERIERVRSKGFDLRTGSRSPVRKEGRQRPSSVRGERIAKDTANAPTLGRSASVRSATGDRPQGRGLLQKASGTTTRPFDSSSDDEPTFHSTPKTQPQPQQQQPPSSSTHYDPFSELHLSKRHIPHPDIARTLSGKELYTLPRLLKEVKSPHYEPPDCENDWVLLAVLASKSSPFDQKQSHRTVDEEAPTAHQQADGPRNKFMVLKLCDLEWEVDCFLFGTAFDHFWKLVPGTLLAILNPGIMPPKTNQHNGRFSLKLGSSEDCVMEIGVARDLAFCSSVKKDGQSCGQWVDGRKTEICEFHLAQYIEKQRKGRMEVNTMWRGHGSNDTTGPRGREIHAFGQKKAGANGYAKNSREYGTLYAIPSGTYPGRTSAAGLLDAEDQGMLLNFHESEASRRRIAEREAERKLQKTLEAVGKANESMGATYIRARPGMTATTTSTVSKAERTRQEMFAKPKAAELGLLGNKAGDAHLSPAKDRKAHFGLGATSISLTRGREAMGWGGARNADLLAPKPGRLGSPERGQRKLELGGDGGAKRSALRSRDGSESPSKKRARFMLADKGVREPGRESGGGVELGLLAGSRRSKVGRGVDDDDVDDDDDLDIV